MSSRINLRQVRRTPLDGAIALLFLALPIGVWASYDPGFSLKRALFVVLGIAAFYALSSFITCQKRLAWALGFFFAMGSIVAFMGLVGTRWLYKFALASALLRQFPQWIRGLPGAAEGFHPNEIAGVLLWFVPLQIAVLGYQLTTRRLRGAGGWALAASTLLNLTTLLLTQSRSGLLGLAVGTLVLGLCVSRRLRLALVLPALAGGLVLATRGGWWFETFWGGPGLRPVMGELNLQFRMEVWKAAVWGIRDFPFTGMGLGMFRYVARALYPLSIEPTYDIAHAHNGFLQAGVDLGLVGLFAYVAVWLSATASLARSLLRSEAWYRAVASGLAGCLFGYLVYNLTDTVALTAKPAPAWWMLLGFIVSVEWLVDGRRRAQVTDGGVL